MGKLKGNNNDLRLKQLEFFNSNGNKAVAKKVSHIKAEVREIEENEQQRKENAKYREILLSHKEELFKMGLIEIEGVWYFDECINWRKWPKIGKNNLISFPGSKWSKARGIGDSAGVIKNREDLKKVFRALGINIATKEQEIERYKNLLLIHKDKLLGIGLIEIDSVLYFFECKQWKSWQKIGKIGNKYLSSFPNATLNKKWGAGNKVGTIQDDKGLKIVCEKLGFTVATEAQELERYKNLLLAHKKKLFQLGLKEIEGIWYFYKCKGNQDWQKIGKIGNKYLSSLIKAEFLKEKGIGRENKGDVVNRAQLKDLFRLVNIPVATARQEIEQMQKDKIIKAENERKNQIHKKGRNVRNADLRSLSGININKEVVDENFRDEFLRFVKRKITNLNKGDYSLSLEYEYLMRLPEISKNVFLEFIEGLPQDEKNEIKEIYSTNEHILQRIDCFVEDRIAILKK